MAYVYILKCADGTYYTGAALDIQKRFLEHQSGKAAKYTRGRRPLELIYAEYYPSLSMAYRREKEIQALRRDQKLALLGQSCEVHSAIRSVSAKN